MFIVPGILKLPHHLPEFFGILPYEVVDAGIAKEVFPDSAGGSYEAVVERDFLFDEWTEVRQFPVVVDHFQIAVFGEIGHQRKGTALDRTFGPSAERRCLASDKGHVFCPGFREAAFFRALKAPVEPVPVVFQQSLFSGEKVDSHVFLSGCAAGGAAESAAVVVHRRYHVEKTVNSTVYIF